MSYLYDLGFTMPAGYEIIPVTDPRFATNDNPTYKGATPAQQRVMEGQYTEALNNALAAEQATLPKRYYYPSQFAKLQAAGVRAAGKAGFNSRTLGQQFGYAALDKEFGYYLVFPDQADYQRATTAAGPGFGSRPHGDANWWILNPDIGNLQAAGAPFTITTQGAVFSKLLLHEYELWKTLYDGLAFHIQQKYKVDPNQFVDPNLTLPNVAPTATPATPEAVVATSTPAAVPAAMTPEVPTTYYPTEGAANDLPPTTTPTTATTPATTSPAPAVLGIGAVLWLLLRK